MATKMWRFLVPMGFVIIVISFIIGIINGINLGEFYGDAKLIREANPNHENFGTVQAIVTWLPGFQLFGVGLTLGGITMILAAILGNLRVAGANVQAAVGAEVVLPPTPTTGKLFPLLMLMGLGVLMAAMLIGVWLSFVAADVYGNSINAVQTQVWIAICVYLLIAIIQKELHVPHSLHRSLQILSITPFEQMPLNALLTDTTLQTDSADDYNQLKLNGL